MNFKNSIYLLAIPILLTSCSSSSNDDLTNDPDPDPTTVTYNNTVQGIIGSNCLGCHGSPTSNGAPISFTTYTQVKNSVDIIISRINSSSNPMPQSGLMSQENRDLIQQWKDDGLLEN